MNRAILDGVLVKTYGDFNVPVDKFLGDSSLIAAFVAAVEVGAGSVEFEPQEIMRRLINLRKKGRLPRLRRAYFGRSPNNN
ncbi:MAG TPA: hypothetical protein DDY78_01075 [Planctomycetales bacterium]|jgi:hypothetical protein|nr:hypothetical protein [Planctomycetales bacterium]